MLICIRGKIDVKLFNGQKTDVVSLLPHQGVVVDKMIWDSQIFHTGDDILLVLCSTNYDKKDYIEDLEDFVKIKEKYENN